MKFIKSRFALYSFISILFIFSLLYLLGIAPLHLEEPTRGLVALEMYYNNIWTPTIFQDIFYDHPPLWNWVIVLSYKIFGVGSIFAVRFFSAISLYLIGLQMYFTYRSEINREFSLLNSLFFITSINIYFYFASIGEIDIFFSLVMISIFNSIYFFYKRQNLALMYFVCFILCAIAFLTKGPIALFTLEISFFAYLLLYHKDAKSFFSPYHFLFGAIFLLIILTYFIKFNQFGDAKKYILAMFGILTGKSGGQVSSYIAHLFTFPFIVFKALFPISILIIYLIKENYTISKTQSPYLLFGLVIVGANILIYWISPGTRIRYIYMLLPYLSSYLVYFFYLNYHRKNLWQNKFLKLLFYTVFIFYIIFYTSLFFIPKVPLPENFIFFSCIMLSSFLVLFYIFYRSNLYSKALCFTIFLMCTKITYNEIVFNHKKADKKSRANSFIQQAYSMTHSTKDKPFYIYQSFTHYKGNSWRFGDYETEFYLFSFLKKPIEFVQSFNKSGVYLVNKDELSKVTKQYKILKEYTNIDYLTDWKRESVLISIDN